MPGRRRESASSTGAGPAERPLDGRLDLDHLDAPLDLDVVGHGSEGPGLAERAARALAATRVVRAARRRRWPAVVALLVLVLAVGGGALWWGSRPEPLPAAPDVLVSASGPDETQVTVYSVDGRLDSLMLRVEVSSAEAPGVTVQLLGLAGPGLASPGGADWSLDPQTPSPDGSALVPGALACGTDASVGTALAATPGDYDVLVRRTSTAGETRVDRVPLVGAQRLSVTVRTACLQAAADRDLGVDDVTATPASGVAAIDVEATIVSTGRLAWSALRAAVAASPWVVDNQRPVTLDPGRATTLHLLLWVQDCAHPTAALASGLSLQADPGGTRPGVFHLPLGAEQLASVTRAAAHVCSTPLPTATVTQAALTTGASATSAGVLQLTVRVHAAGLDLVEIAGTGPTPGGTLTVLATPVHLTRGTGTAGIVWVLPTCAQLVAAGIPPLPLALVRFDGAGGQREPYVVALRGDALRVELRRACGEAAAALVH